MAVCALSKAFRQLNICKKDIISVRYSTQTASTRTIRVNAAILQVERPPASAAGFEGISFGLRSIGLGYPIPRGELPLQKIIENPFKPTFEIENPIKNNVEKSDVVPDKVIETPATDNVLEKKAERMIVIRRKKMKRHKRKKWLKKFKFVIRKKKQRKRNLKEKAFQNELQAMIAKANEFNAEQYVAERLEILTRQRVPPRWRGEPLPEEMVLQFMKERKEKKAHKRRLLTYRLSLDD